MAKIRYAVGALLLCAALTGCATKKPQMYQWEGYQGNVDSYFRGDKASPDAQLRSMEDGLQKIRASGGTVPPGYNAHLGLLYAQQGNLDRFTLQLQAEKTQYPESEVFMDFLTRNLKKK